MKKQLIDIVLQAIKDKVTESEYVLIKHTLEDKEYSQDQLEDAFNAGRDYMTFDDTNLIWEYNSFDDYLKQLWEY